MDLVNFVNKLFTTFFIPMSKDPHGPPHKT